MVGEDVWAQQTLLYVDAGFKMILSVKLLHGDHWFRSDIIEKCLLSTFTQVLLSLGETRFGKDGLPAAIYAS